MFEIKGKNFFLNGEKFNIYSGAMHYFRIPAEYWEDRLQKLKACGFNTVETYVAWNMHEPSEGEFCFEGRSDIVRFIKTAQKVGLYVIVRPGPYICAEWDFGGIPSWLLKHEDLRVRCYSEPYISHVKNYFNVLLPLLAPLQITNGGPVIMMQVENEYRSYASDKKYLRFLRDLMRENGIDVPLFTSDGESKYHFSGGGLPDVLKVVNFGSFPNTAFNDLKECQPDRPLMCGEQWCGRFDHFYEKHHGSIPKITKKTYTRMLNEFFENDANFNFYMFHGGTNFGYMAGANFSNIYQPTTTSALCMKNVYCPLRAERKNGKFFIKNTNYFTNTEGVHIACDLFKNGTRYTVHETDEIVSPQESLEIPVKVELKDNDDAFLILSYTKSDGSLIGEEQFPLRENLLKNQKHEWKTDSKIYTLKCDNGKMQWDKKGYLTSITDKNGKEVLNGDNGFVPMLFQAVIANHVYVASKLKKAGLDRLRCTSVKGTFDEYINTVRENYAFRKRQKTFFSRNFAKGSRKKRSVCNCHL